MGVGHEHCCQTGGREILRNGDFENATLERNVSTHHVPLEICWRRADTYCFFCVAPSLMEQDSGSFSSACWCKRVFSPQLLGSYVQIDCFWPTFFCLKLVCRFVFPWYRYNQLQDVCNFVHVCFVFLSFFRFPFLMFKTEFGAFGVSNLWTLPPSPPETRPHYGMSDSSYEHRCGLESSVIWRWDEMIEIWLFQIQHLKCLQDDGFKSDLRLISV